MAFWAKWEERFKMFGASRTVFSTYKKGGSQSGKIITSAKCLLFFDCDHQEQPIKLQEIIDQTFCSDRLEVSMNEEEDFGFSTKDRELGCFFGTKVGYPIFEFTPVGLPESRGKDKHRPGIIMSRVFKLKKHRQQGEGKSRPTSYSFQETKGVVFLINLRGVH